MAKLLFFIIAVSALLLSACTGVTSLNKTAETENSYRVISVEQLKTMMENKDFLLVNVHIPYAGEIEGTDLFLPYNEIEHNLDKLPADKNARIVAYCRSGMMSKTAAKTLVSLGYTEVIDVTGGMIAWENAGYQLIEKPAR